MTRRGVLAAFLVLASACSASSEDGPTTSTATDAAPAPTDAAEDSSAPSAPDGEATDTTEAPVPPGGSITVAVDAIRAVALADVAAEFTTATGIEVVFSVREFADLRSAAADSRVDVFMGPHIWIDDWLAEARLEPIAGVEASEFIPIASDSMSRNGELYGVPFAAESLVLFTNLDRADPPAELLDGCPETGRCFVMPGFGEAGGYHLTAFLMAEASGSLVDQLAGADSDRGTAAFLALEASPDHEFTTIAEARQGFLDGAAFFIGGPWDLGPIEDAGLSVAVTAIPNVDGISPSAPVSVLGFFQRADTGTEAAQFLAWVSGPDEQRELWLRDRRAPVHIEVTDLGPLADGFRAGVESGFLLPSVDLEIYWEELGAAAEAIYAGTLPPDALAAAVERIAERIP